MRRLVSIALVAALAVIAGCTPPKPIIVVKQVEPTSAVAAAPLTGKPLPKGFPADVPLWPGARVANAQFAGIGKQDQYTLDLVTTDKYSSVVDGMLRGVKKAGWTVTQQNDLSSGPIKAGVLGYSKGKVQVLATMQSQTPSQTLLTVVVTK